MIFTNIYFLLKLILTDGKLPNSINPKKDGTYQRQIPY